MLEAFGIWDQVRVDCGRECALILFIQHLLADNRTNTTRAPYLQTQSTQVIAVLIDIIIVLYRDYRTIYES